MTRRSWLAPAGALCLALALTACGPEERLSGESDDPGALESVAGLISESPTPEPSPTPSPTPTEDPADDLTLVEDQLAAFFDIAPSEAACFVDEFRQAGFTMDQLAGLAGGDSGDVDAEAYTLASASAIECLSPESLNNFLEATLDTPQGVESAREGFIVSFLQTAPAGTTRQQASCMFDEIVASDVGFAPFVTSSPGQLPPAAQQVLEDAAVTCGLV